MPKVRVPIVGTIGKSVRVNPDATDGATIGVNLFNADGSLAILGTETIARRVAATEIDLQVLTGQIVDVSIVDTGAITSRLLAAGAVLEAALADNAVSLNKLELASFRPVQIVATLPTLPNATYPINSVVILTTDSKMYRNNADVWTAAIATVDLSGTISLDTQVSGTLSAAFAEAGLINAGVTINANGTLSGAGAGQASLTNLPGSVQVGSIAANAVTAGTIAALAVTAAKIAANTITAGQIAANTITANEILANTITGAKIAANAIDTVQLNALAVTAAKIAVGTITANEIAAGTITAGQIAANTITAAKIAALTITAGEIAANAVTAVKISVANLAAIQADLGAITAGTITLNSTGHIKGSQTAYNTGSGFWLGRDGAVSKFSIGDGAANFLTWDGTALKVRGNISIGSYVASNNILLSANTARTTTGIYPTTLVAKSFDLNRPGTVRVTFNVKMASVTGGVVNAGSYNIKRNGVSQATGTYNTAAYVAKSHDITLTEAADDITIEITNGERNTAEPFVSQSSIQNAQVKLDKNDGEAVLID